MLEKYRLSKESMTRLVIVLIVAAIVFLWCFLLIHKESPLSHCVHYNTPYLFISQKAKNSK